MQQPTIFNFNNQNLTVITDERTGEPWFYAKELCDNLLIVNHRDAIKSIPTELKGVVSTDTLGGKQGVAIVNEKGLYRLVMRSRKKEAESFKNWLADDVIPTLRKTGKYEMNKIPNGKQLLLDSKQNRNTMTDVWQAHGAEKNIHYINLTKQEYQVLFGNKKLKKKDLSDKDKTILSMLEFTESMKLSQNKDISGYYELKDSVTDTGSKLVGFFESIGIDCKNTKQIGV